MKKIIIILIVVAFTCCKKENECVITITPGTKNVEYKATQKGIVTAQGSIMCANTDIRVNGKKVVSGHYDDAISYTVYKGDVWVVEGSCTYDMGITFTTICE